MTVKEKLRLMDEIKAANDKHMEDLKSRKELKAMVWYHAIFPITMKNGEKKFANYWVKISERKSKYGIDGGKIFKLQIEIDDIITANYDCGWYITPAPDDEATLTVYHAILGMYN